MLGRDNEALPTVERSLPLHPTYAIVMDTEERALIGFQWYHEAITWFEHTLKFTSK